MTDFVIDIRTKIVSPSARIWRMFPGDQYQFLAEFLKSSVVFLDLPGLNLPEGIIEEKTPTVRESIIRSSHTRRWIEDYKEWAKTSGSERAPQPPAANLETYKTASKNRNFGRNLGSIKALFSDAQKGDLVVVPNKIPTRNVLIGEFLDAPGARNGHSLGKRYLEQTTAYRRVSWFPPVNELRIPSSISDVLRIPVPISLLPAPFFKNILELSYGNYIRGDEVFCRLVVDTEDFNAQNTFDLGSIAKLAALLSADLPDAEIEAELPNYLDFMLEPRFEPTLTLNINSPGSGGFRASTLAPIVLVCLLSYLPNASGKSDPSKNSMKITNSVERPDACVTDADKPLTTEIEEKVAQRLALIGILEHNKACQRAQRLLEGAKLHTDARTRHQP